MSTKARKIRVGLFVAVTGLLLAIVLFTFAGLRFWQGKDRYHIVFSGTVMGLEAGARVFLNGTKVGVVEHIDVAKDDLRNVEVTIALKEGTPIHADTQAMLQYAGITGLKVIDLRAASARSPRVPPGSRIAAGETVIDKLQKQAETIAEQSAEMMTRANRLVGQLEGMGDIVASARTTSTNLADASAALKAMVSENRQALRGTMLAVAETAKSASTLLDGHMSQLVANADSLVSDVKSVVHRNDTALRTAVFDLRQASRTFKELAREVRQRPSRLLFSDPVSERKLPK